MKLIPITSYSFTLINLVGSLSGQSIYYVHFKTNIKLIPLRVSVKGRGFSHKLLQHKGAGLMKRFSVKINPSALQALPEAKSNLEKLTILFFFL